MSATPTAKNLRARPLFTHDRDGLKHTAAERYLAGGETAKAKPHDLMHLIISFNSHDRRELEKLERGAEGRSPKSDRSKAERKKDKESISDQAEILQTQVERDLPYVRAVRLMMANIEERADHSDLRYALTVHRHTGQTHVHLLLRREHTDKQTGAKIYFAKQGLPAEFLNGRDERGKARGGLIDQALSDSLDTMIPRRNRQQAETERPPAQAQPHELSSHNKVHNLNFAPVSPAAPVRTVHNLNFARPGAQNNRDKRSRVEADANNLDPQTHHLAFIRPDAALALPPQIQHHQTATGYRAQPGIQHTSQGQLP